MAVKSIIIFGASGDLTSRKLIPALFQLDLQGLLPEECAVIGVARSPYTSETFGAEMKPKVRHAVEENGDVWRDGAWARFARRLFYVQGDGSTAEGLQKLDEFLKTREKDQGGDRLYYLSVAPELYTKIAGSMKELGFNKETGGYRRLVIEKPFGRNLESAKELNQTLHSCFRESQIYRIDHYLGKETVQNILIFRFANSMFEPLWSNQYIDHVQITVSEKVVIGKRAGYYDTSGVLRDMFQSHLLQVLTMIAMDAPSRVSADRLRNEKVKVLESVTIPTVEEARNCVALGQYEGYRQEPGVPEGSKTPTYAAIRLHIDNWRWHNTPFYIRSGKGLAARSSEIVIQFKKPPHLMFPLPPTQEMASNRLTLRLQPDEKITLTFQTKVPSVDGTQLEEQELAFDYRESFSKQKMPEAYERLLLDAMMGDASLFMRSDEIERAWEIMDPIIQASEMAGGPEPDVYRVNGDGPESANELLSRDGRKWSKIH